MQKKVFSIAAILLICLIVVITGTLAGCTKATPTTTTAASTTTVKPTTTTAATTTTATQTTTTAAPTTAVKTITLKANIPLPPTHIRSVILAKYLKQWEATTNGRVKVVIYDSGTLAASTAQIDAIGSGLADMGEIYFPYYSGNLAIAGAHQLPFLFDDIDHHVRVLQSPEYNAWLANILVPYNIVHTGSAGFVGMYQIVSSKKQIKLPADLKGLTVKASGAIPTDLTKLAGGVPVNIDTNAIYEGFMRGSLDAAIWAGAGQPSFKVWEVAKYVTEINMYPSEVTSLDINKDTWNKLSAEDQKSFVEMNKAAYTEISKTYQADELPTGILGKNYREKYTFYTLTTAEKDQWRQLAAPVIASFRNTLPENQRPLLDQYLSIVEKYRTK